MCGDTIFGHIKYYIISNTTQYMLNGIFIFIFNLKVIKQTQTEPLLFNWEKKKKHKTSDFI